MQDIAYALWKASPVNWNSPATFASFMGNHYFTTSPSGLSPVWDFRGGPAKGNPDAFVLAAKVADVPAPTGPQDVDWLQLKSVSGSLATQVCVMFYHALCPFNLMRFTQIYRTDTRGGSSPTSVRCQLRYSMLLSIDHNRFVVYARVCTYIFEICCQIL